jgi:uncharacterized protein (DUF4415 family)
MKKRGLVVYEIDLENPPPLSAARRRELKKLAERPDEEIDFSEIPLATEKFWKNAVRNPFLPVKKQVTVRVDADVLAWLRSAGRGYQTKLNAILRDAMLRDVAKR